MGKRIDTVLGSLMFLIDKFTSLEAGLVGVHYEFMNRNKSIITDDFQMQEHDAMFLDV